MERPPHQRTLFRMKPAGRLRDGAPAYRPEPVPIQDGSPEAGLVQRSRPDLPAPPPAPLTPGALSFPMPGRRVVALTLAAILGGLSWAVFAGNPGTVPDAVEQHALPPPAALSGHTHPPQPSPQPQAPRPSPSPREIPPDPPGGGQRFPVADTPYVVSPGDTLWGIAEDLYGDPLRWPDLATENDLLPPYCIFPEQALSLPATTRK